MNVVLALEHQSDAGDELANGVMEASSANGRNRGMTSRQSVSRRSFIVGGMVTVASAPLIGFAQTPNVSHLDPISILPQGMLESATVAPEYQTYVTHSTMQVPASTLDDACRLKVYPHARRTLSAVAVVMRAVDMTQSPNTVLVQKMVYRDAELAASEYQFMVQEVVDVLAGMLLRQPQFAATDDPEGTRRRFEYLEPNDCNYALQVERIEDEIHVVRAGGFSDPDWNLVDTKAEWLAATNLDALQRLENHDGWVVSYGPFDFHPDAYAAPDCFGP